VSPPVVPPPLAAPTYRSDDLSGSTVAAKVGLGPDRLRGYGLAVALSVSLPVLDSEVAARLVDAAHEVCPYSNATRDNIDVTILLG
jgi:organic hydroperoxide reductase OsmC/OhrA